MNMNELMWSRKTLNERGHINRFFTVVSFNDTEYPVALYDSFADALDAASWFYKPGTKVLVGEWLPSGPLDDSPRCINSTSCWVS